MLGDVDEGVVHDIVEDFLALDSPVVLILDLIPLVFLHAIRLFPISLVLELHQIKELVAVRCAEFLAEHALKTCSSLS